MGLMRRVESRMERAAGVGSRDHGPREFKRVPSDKKSKLYVRPDELARKLVREMEASKVAQPAVTLVCSAYTIYLCPIDHERLMARKTELVAKLERHIAKHARAKRYEVLGDMVVSIECDPDLQLGYFGILAERVAGERGVVLMPAEAVRPAVTPAMVSTRLGDDRPPATAARDRSANSRGGEAKGSTEVIRASDATQFGLARQTIVLKAGSRVREFSQGRVIVGRARDVDFRVEDPNVSRRHAAIFWADGRLVVEDLESTNGTLVNGYPITNTVLKPNDVVVVGDCRITVKTR